MTARERELGQRVELAAGFVIEAIVDGTTTPAEVKRMTRDLWHKAAALRKAQIAARNRRIASRDRADLMRSLGLRRCLDGSWE